MTKSCNYICKKNNYDLVQILVPKVIKHAEQHLAIKQEEPQKKHNEKYRKI